MWFLPHNYLRNIWFTPNILVLIFENFYCLLDFEFELELFLDHREINNSNRGDVASLAWNYCSLIIRASQFSSTTRNLVPRFKRWSKGDGIWLRNSNGSSRSWLLSSKRSIHYVDVSISLLQVTMIKSSSFLRDLHRATNATKGKNSGRMHLHKAGHLTVNSMGNAQGIPRVVFQ